MKKTILFIFVFVCAISLFSCATNEPITCNLPDNVPNSNSPLVPGGTLKLLGTSPNSNLDVNYIWSGPNNFQSNIQNPIISNITASMAGVYKLKTIKGICESSENSVIVEINAPNVPCNPDTNTLIINGDLLNPREVSAYSTNYNQNFKIIASSLRDQLTIEFASEERPTPGIYTICSDCPTSFLKKDQVCVSYKYPYQAQEGLVYLSSSNGKLTATFCNINFSSEFTFKISAKLTEY
jgi:hypothetical protein